jgi:phospholipid transport system substrate-binding protein
MALAASVVANASAHDSEVGAAAFIESIGGTALKILQSEEISSDVREFHIRKLLQESVDLKKSARVVLGPNWKRATVEQREEFETLFADYVLRIYPRALSKHAAEEFVITGWKEMPGSDTLVYTRAVDAAGENFIWGWRVTEIDGEYKAIDLTWGGVSMTATLRAEFHSYIFDTGMNGLLEKLRSTE